MATATLIELMDDMHLSNQSIFKEYYGDVSDGNMALVENLLTNNPDITNQLTEAEFINKVINIINSGEEIPKTEIDNYLNTLFQNFQNLINQTKVMGTFDQTIQYYIHNLVYYNEKGYYAYQNPPLGTLPTDTNYWIEYDIKGLKGYGGVNLNFKFAWQANTQYQAMDCVYYRNKLWFANQANINIAPNLNHYPWVPVMIPMQPIKTKISTTTPSNIPNGNFWFKITEGSDIIQTKWSLKAVEPTPRLAAASFVFGNKIHIVGGENSLDVATNVHEIYDTETDTWSVGVDLPEALGGSGFFTIGNKGYVVGGITPQFTIASKNYIYDNTTNTWSNGADLPVSNWTPFSNSISDGTLGYCLGGEYTVSGIPINFAYSYNPTTDIWTQLTNLPDNILGSSTQYYNGKIYLIGGWNYTGASTMKTYIYDIASNSWSTGASPIYNHMVSASFINNGKIYLAGGLSDDWFSIASSEIYDIATNTFTREVPLIHTCNSASGNYCNGYGYVMGGININNDFGTFGYNEQYNFS